MLTQRPGTKRGKVGGIVLITPRDSETRRGLKIEHGAPPGIDGAQSDSLCVQYVFSSRITMAFFRGLSAVVALVVLEPSCAEAFGSTPDRESRTPFAFDVSGGGFRTMTVGMGFARALSEAFDEVGGGWADITHLSGNSGGNWFATQFAFGKEFYTELTQRHMVLGYKSMPAILADWANGYSENIKAIQDIPFEPNVCIVDIGFVQLNVTKLVEGFVQALTFLTFPPSIGSSTHPRWSKRPCPRLTRSRTTNRGRACRTRPCCRC